MEIHNSLSEMFKRRRSPSCPSSVTSLLLLCYKMFSKSNLQKKNILKWCDRVKKTCDFYFATCISLVTAWISWVGVGFCSISGQKSVAADPMNGNCCKTPQQPQPSRRPVCSSLPVMSWDGVLGIGIVSLVVLQLGISPSCPKGRLVFSHCTGSIFSQQ